MSKTLSFFLSFLGTCLGVGTVVFFILTLLFLWWVLLQVVWICLTMKTHSRALQPISGSTSVMWPAFYRVTFQLDATLVFL